MVLALALFVGAATVVSTGINASVQAAFRLRLQTHASNLAISLLSEMQMGARPIATAGPEPFPAPFEEWSYRIEISQDGDTALESEAVQPVEVIVSHSSENVVHRLTQLFRASEITSGDSEEELSGEGGLL